MFACLTLSSLRVHFLTLCMTGGVLVVSPNLALAQCSGGGGGGGGRVGGGGSFGGSSGSSSTGTTGVNVSPQMMRGLAGQNSQNAAAASNQAMAAFSDVYAGDLWMQQIAWEEGMADRQEMMRQARIAARRAALARQRRMNSASIALTQKSGWNKPSMNQSTASKSNTSKTVASKTTASKVKVASLPAQSSASLSKPKSNPLNQSSTDILVQK